MTKIDRAALIEAALAARKSAYCPSTGYAVGAAVAGESGRIYPGCNVESPTAILNVCAERSAIYSALAHGERRITAVSTASAASLPCGVCRQALLEFGGVDTPVFSVMLGRGAGKRRVVKTTVGKLLPGAHTGATVEKYTK